MKKEVSPAVMGIAIAFVVILLGVYFYRTVAVNPPSAHPKMSFSNSGAPSNPAGGATGATGK